MNGGSLGMRSGSYGSLLQQQQQQQQLQNGGLLPVQATPLPPPLPGYSLGRKPPKMVKEKERFVHWICKFAGRKKVGMLLLCVVSAAVFVWVLYVGKGEDAREVDSVGKLGANGSPAFVYTKSFSTRSLDLYRMNNSSFVRSESVAQPPPPPPPPPPPAPVFLGYNLPPGHPCENFALPPPPADKKRTGPRPCPVCYLPVEEAIALMPKYPSPSPLLNNLTFVYEENLTKGDSFGGSDFGGYPSLDQRANSYDIRESMTVHCGFVRGAIPGQRTGFNMDDSDLFEMEQCHGVVVASAIFGNYDVIQQPKNISDAAKENVCFYMFVDEETEAHLKNSSGLDDNKRVGLWRIVVVHNLPYNDARRNGKVPKLLLHRMFPNARYSLWIDGKLELVVDPFQILERFLWRKNASFAISRHYRRFDVFVEAEANKAAAKYDNASIDFQVEFYKSEGLTPYSEAKLPITSDVPEGCVIVREHIPISNLFTCLWFNEVDRFTSRDQISFSTVRDKIRAKTNWTVNMFLDCERRNFVVQGYHRDVLEHMASSVALPPPLVLAVEPPPLVNKLPVPPPPPPPPPPPEISTVRVVSNPVTRVPAKRSRERRSSSKRHRKVVAGAKGIDSS
ncbi:hypothetical protein VitviT2T_015086 [Vitis vinifera]|uniref:TOD1/MUCI70 glycosyltransferase-like domain-containing protein n=1 Tax=Vitis vinifera TaxID=29760 RepID=A0ABY9CQP6_VITVI|nr:probable hexosyltransferase MUCI70 [Vitis vinifera]WJZ96395.1 hypothetical protein VitviT2T_015086 [Vitis vinifera]